MENEIKKILSPDFIYLFLTVRMCNFKRFVQVFGNVKRKTGRKYIFEV